MSARVVGTGRRFARPFVLALTLPAAALAHDHTLRRFESERRVAVGRLGQETVDVRQETATCALTLHLADARTSRPLAGLVRIHDLERDKPLRLRELVVREQGWYAMLPGAQVTVPRRRLRIEALQGLETEVARQDLDLTVRDAASVTLRLRRLYDARSRGWTSGNTHLHLRGLSRDEAIRYLQTVSRADGLDLVFLSYLSRPSADQEYISNTFTPSDLDRLSSPAGRFAHGEEHRHNFDAYGEGYGHVLFLPVKRLIEPVSLGPGLTGAGTDGAPLRRGILQARQDGATVIWAHNRFGLEDIPSWIGGLLDAQNIFDGGSEGDYRDTFYRYLDVGLRVPFSTGTDWFVYDFSRVYVPLRVGETTATWLRELGAGRSFITNGPFLELEVDGQGIGDTVARKGATTVRVKGRGLGRLDFGALELVHDGGVVARVPSRRVAGHFEAEMDVPLTVQDSGWLALRIALTTDKNELGHPLFAHTSPIYVQVAGRTIFRAEAAEALRRDIEASIDTVRARGTFKDDAEREGVLDVYRRAIEKLAGLRGR